MPKKKQKEDNPRVARAKKKIDELTAKGYALNPATASDYYLRSAMKSQPGRGPGVAQDRTQYSSLARNAEAARRETVSRIRASGGSPFLYTDGNPHRGGYSSATAGYFRHTKKHKE